MNTDNAQQNRLGDIFEERLLTTEEVATFLGISAQMLKVDRMGDHHRIPFVRLGRCIRYRRRDVETWLSANTVRAKTQE